MTTRFEKRPIVVIEDDKYDQMLLKQALAEAGSSLSTVFLDSGEEALQYFYSQPDNPGKACLIFLDLGLPGIRGEELLKRLRDEAVTRHIPVVICSLLRDEKAIGDSYGEGASSYIAKSSDLHVMKEKLVTAAQYWSHCRLPC